jgi:hypothetical protein
MKWLPGPCLAGLFHAQGKSAAIEGAIGLAGLAMLALTVGRFADAGSEAFIARGKICRF